MGNELAPWPYSLVGLPWAEAKAHLEARGEVWQELRTAPPRAVAGEGDLRVVAERPGAAGLTVILAHTTYQSGPARHG